MKNLIIAIDGFSSCGKSTVAKEMAKYLNYRYIDTGAMYRAITYFCLQNNIIKNKTVNEEKLKSELKNINIDFKFNNETKQNELILNNENIENQIRGIEVSNNVSIVSKIKFVREFLVKQQRKMGENKRIVMDGRDIGTVVFPNADLKIFMTANPDIRAKRRYDELSAKGENVIFDEIKKNINERDYLDQNRKESPLKKADDALVLDNSNLSREEQLNWIIEKINKL